mmetsp:Transcript_21131/g.45962  ORF Transcript_21131/g.45962 Transcript_21131/m.45962 type:complete len:749 (+) Transcript_21131:79-2325(+)
MGRVQAPSGELMHRGSVHARPVSQAIARRCRHLPCVVFLFVLSTQSQGASALAAAQIPALARNAPMRQCIALSHRSRIVVSRAAKSLEIDDQSSLAEIRAYVKEHDLDVKTAGKGRTKAIILAEIAQLRGSSGKPAAKAASKSPPPVAAAATSPPPARSMAESNTASVRGFAAPKVASQTAVDISKGKSQPRVGKSDKPDSSVPKKAKPPPPPPPETTDYTALVVVLVVFATLLVGFTVTWVVLALRWHRNFKNSLLASAPTLNPPTTKWVTKNKDGVACFLSHYKLEAGSDARYLHDLLQRMLTANVFLDSNDLTDLRALFSHVQLADVLVLLATEGVLLRPWCLLELYQAYKLGIPILIMEVDAPRHRFDKTAAKRFLRNLEVDLPQLNPGAIEEITKHLAKVGDTVSIRDFRDTLLDALEPQLSTATDQLKFHPWGTDNTVLADATDLIMAMARATEREVKLQRPSPPRNIVLCHAICEFTKQQISRASRKKASQRPSTRRRKTSLGTLSGRSASSFGEYEDVQYALFISYFREEAGCDARLLQLMLVRKLDRPVFLDATDADDIRKILSAGVCHSDALVLVQTAGVLHRPWCLLEVYTAIRNRVPVLPLLIEGGGYNFDEARAHLADLGASLDRTNAGTAAALRELLASGVVPLPPDAAPATLEDMSLVLSKSIPFLISGAFNPAGSENHVAAAVQARAQPTLPRSPVNCSVPINFIVRIDIKSYALPGLTQRATITSSLHCAS